LTGVDFGLPIKREMIAKLRDDHLGAYLEELRKVI
jgi:hypothetical protein